MNYDINIIGSKDDNGTIELDRLSNLAKSTKDIATKALMFRYKGFSQIPPDNNLKNSLNINLEHIGGNDKDGTKLTFECKQFSDTIKNFQLDFFNDTDKLMKMTPMALVIDTFKQALKKNTEDAELDKPLLKSLLNFKKNFINNDEIFLLSNRGTIAEIEIKKDDFLKISKLEESIPNPKRVIISGKLDEMKVSEGRLGLQTNDGLVYIYTSDVETISNILEYMGKDITINGTGHFKPNGEVNFVDIIAFEEYKLNDQHFNKKPLAYNSMQQVLHQTKKGKKRNPISDLLGNWPGNESDKEFDDLLKSLKL